MNPIPRASAVLLLLLLAPAMAWGKSSDRSQPMGIQSDSQVGSFDDNGTTVLTGNVVLSQGSLAITAGRAELSQRNGDPSQAIFTGKPVKLRQQLDDGSWMDAVADRMEYDMTSEVITFLGNYTVKSPKGSNSGQKMVYNTKTSNMQAGGDGSRVNTIIYPKSAQGQKPASPDKPSDKP
ncbi:MAG: lipopolysaccharide transport periplasmic protein LptA [Pseudoxanthomonas sp.]